MSNLTWQQSRAGGQLRRLRKNTHGGRWQAPRRHRGGVHSRGYPAALAARREAISLGRWTAFLRRATGRGAGGLG
jgi:hypothetical protein